MRACVAVLSLVVLSIPARAADTKQLADQLVHELREMQHEDGSYGESITDTCRVLDLFSRSPRHYSDLDGPFFRKASQLVVHTENLPQLDGWRALALANCFDPDAVRVRDAALDRMLLMAERQWGKYEFEELLAINRLRPDDAPRPPQNIVNSGNPAIRMLLARDPTRVPPPRLKETMRWAHWAQAAWLRGVTPEAWPDAPETRPGRSFTELCDDLELVLAIHGLRKPEELLATTKPPEPPPFVSGDPDRPAALRRALDYLGGQQVDGRFGLATPGWDGPEPGVTALCLAGALAAVDELGAERPEWIDQGLGWLASLQDGAGAISLYGMRVYTTSAAVEALIAGKRPGDGAVVERAIDFLRTVQADEGEGYSPDVDPYYGGIGYGNDERPDLSNTQFALEAMRRAGLPESDAVFKKALVFLRRVHNLGEEQGDEWPRPEGGVVVSGTDGGGIYYPGGSEAGEDKIRDGVYVARSYGSMTYALTKSYLLCGLAPDSPRVQAAVTWLLDHFSLEKNPGFEDGNTADGLYYYYMAMARTLSRLPAERLARDGKALDWRPQLQDHVLRQQRVDGSWTNDRSGRWYEGSPTLCTGYALLTLASDEP